MASNRSRCIAGGFLGVGLLAALWLAAPSPAASAAFPATIDLPRPGDREFILDRASLITDADKQKIRGIADKLLTDKAAPIIVVTIESMAKYGGEGLRIETFARLLFDQWSIGPAEVGGAPWNYGILLLVSRDDHKARIELGAGWKRDEDDAALRIMDGQIIPRFKQGEFSGGIVAGVEALDKLARELQLPSQRSQAPHEPREGSEPAPGQPFGAAERAPTSSHPLLTVLLIGLAVFTFVSLMRRGSGGWAWLFWGAIFGVVGTILYQTLNSRNDSDRWPGGGGSSGGGFSGGSFGGGYSGGGGATGSW